ncbi:hypothetical protein F5I97DRAFT_1889701 [Phlebopus sp. FC_14]|nr:hypothetical protein F5I97DRAFT_1889701 [Phlebopus sp. FC_14]
MIPVANLHLKDLYETTVEFFALRSPSFSFRAFTTDDSDSDHSLPLTPRDLSQVPDLIDRLQKECADLRVKLHAAERAQPHSVCSLGASTAASSLYAMRRDFDATKNELSRTQAELSQLQDRYKFLERTLKETRELLKLRDGEIETLKKEKDKLIADRRSRERPSITLDRRRSQDIARRRSNSSQSLLSQHVRLSADWTEDRDADAASQASSSRHADSDVGTSIVTISVEEQAQGRSAETFLTKTDSWSGAQIIEKVHDLNSEILQFAASAVEFCTFAKQRPAQAKISQTKNEVSTRLGATLTHILSSRDHSQDPMLVQMALQGCISFCVSRALSSFCIGYQSKANTALTQIYTRMFQSEPQPTSSRWRALTHKHIHNLYPKLDEYAIKEMTETILRWSLDVFVICGMTDPQPVSAVLEPFRDRFKARVDRISSSACKLAKITKEDILSANFEVVCAESGRPFDAQEMIDAFEEYGASKGAVLCTTELGLRRSTSNAEESTAEVEGNAHVEQRFLLRPKVILESAVEMIDQR